MKPSLKFIFTLLLCTVLSGCGFHFRDATMTFPHIKTIYIQDEADARTGLVFSLRQNLEALGVHPLDAAKNANMTLVILSDNFNQSTTPLGTAQQLNAQTLTYTVKVVLRDAQGKNHRAPTQLSTQITFWQNANQILGDTNAMQQLRQNLVRDMTHKILAYLSANET